MARGGGISIVALLFLVPLVRADAVDVHGELSTPAGLAVEPSATGNGVVLGAYLPNAGGASMVIDAARLRVQVFEYERLDALRLDQYVLDHSRSFDLTKARAETAGAETGWVGYYGDSNLDPVASLRMRETTIQPSTKSIGNTEDAAIGEAQSAIAAFRYAPTVPFLLAQGAGEFSETGSVTIKLFGPTVRFVANENQTTYWTGSHPSETTPGGTTVRWIVLSSAGATFRVGSATPIQIALQTADLHVEGGVVRATFASGILRSADGSFVATDESTILAGTLALALRTSADQGVPRIDADVTGTLTSTSLALARAPVSGASGTPWLFVGLVAMAFATGGAILARRTYKHRIESLTVEQFTDLAYSAADAGHFAEALEWVQQARKLAPTSERLRLDESTFHAEAGDVDGALLLLAAISRDSATGEADYYAALLRLRRGDNAADALPLALRALKRTPFLALEMQDDSAFGALREEPAYRRAISAAFRKIDDEPSGLR